MESVAIPLCCLLDIRGIIKHQTLGWEFGCVQSHVRRADVGNSALIVSECSLS